MKIRGTAHHIGEKYLQLARDAQSSGDPVMAESYLQHAEHYFRLIASAQLAQQQAQFGYQRQPGETLEVEEDADDDFDSLPDRFASPGERTAPAPQPPQQPFEQRNDRPYSDRQPYDNRANNGHGGNGGNSQYGERQQERHNDNRPRQPYAERQERNGPGQQDRFVQERSGQERSAQDRGGQDRGGQERYDRNNGQERNGQERNGPERNGPERNAQDRNAQDRNGPPQTSGASRDERQARDYDNRGFRNRGRDGQARDFRDTQRQPVPEEQPSVGLPAFITAPSRVAVTDVAEAQAEQPIIASTESPANAPEGGEDFHMRPRRRRRPKAELADGVAGGDTLAVPAGESGDPE